MEIILMALGWAAVAASAEVTVSCLARRAAVAWPALHRGSGPVRVADAGLLLPKLSGTVSLSALAALGIHPLLCILGALALAAWAVLPLAAIQYHAIRQQEGMKAARRIFGILPHLAWTARSFLLEDLRVPFRRRDDDATVPVQGAAAGPVPVRATPGVPPWRRTVPGIPSFKADPALGAIPAPSEVSAALAASGVIVPPAWAAVASEAADFEPESDEELCEHMDGEVAGVLTWAEGVMARAETLGDVVGLDPAYISAQYEFADDVAELAAHGAQVMRRYHDHYDDLREAADGKPLPPAFWFGDGTDRAVGPA